MKQLVLMLSVPKTSYLSLKLDILGENFVFLQEIEELTLYVLKADKRIAELKEEINELKKK